VRDLCEKSRSDVLPGNLTLSEFGVICAVRILFPRSKDPSKWEKILQFEAHTEGRWLSPIDSQTTAFVIDFVQQKCKLMEFEAEIIEQVTGILKVVSFWSTPSLGR